MIGFSKGKCRLCGKEDSLNEGICAAHSSDAAQGYLFGYADGLKAQPETGEAKLRAFGTNNSPDEVTPITDLTEHEVHDYCNKLNRQGYTVEAVEQMRTAAIIGRRAALQASPVEECLECDGTGEVEDEPCFENSWGEHGLNSRLCPNGCKPKAAPVPKDQWQPISTAPKDRSILLYNAGERGHEGRWYHGTGTGPVGWRFRGIESTPILPTHWMPLPAEPSASEGE